MKSIPIAYCVVLTTLMTLVHTRSLLHHTTVRQQQPNTTTPDTNNDPFATEEVVHVCDKPETFAGFNPANCEKLAAVITRAHLTETNKYEVASALLILLYFAGLAFIMFSLVTIVRIHALGARSKYAVRGCWIFAISLSIVAILMPIIRSLLAPFDGEVLGLSNTNFRPVLNCCSRRTPSWPRADPNVPQPLLEKPFMGEPPRNYWPFWLVVAAATGTTLSLLLTLAYLRWDETRGLRAKAGVGYNERGGTTPTAVEEQVDDGSGAT